MKKLLSLILVAVLCLGVLTSCDAVETVKGGFNTAVETVKGGFNTAVNTVKGWLGMEVEPDEPEVIYNLDKAAEYVNSLYRADSEITASDYELVARVQVAAVFYTVDWSVDSELIKATKVTKDDGKTVWVIDVPDEAEADISYKLTATITAGDNTTKTVSFDRKVPKFELNSWAEYMAAEKGDNVIVQGIVVAISSKSTGAKRNHLYLIDETGVGGYFNYNIEKDPIADLGIEVGMTVRMTGEISPSNGMQEIYQGTVSVISTEKKTVTPIDITNKFVEGTDFSQLVALPVVIKGVTLGGQDLEDPNHQYLYFTLNGIESYVRTYVTDFPSTLVEKDKATIDALHDGKEGYSADVTGILILYSGAPYILPTSVDCFSNIFLPERTDAQKVELELDGISAIPTDVIKETTLTLPLVGTTYDAVKFSWACDDESVVIGEDGSVTIALGADAKTLKFTVTATIGEGDAAVTDTKEFTVNVAASFVMSETLGYVPYISIGTYGEPLYLDGGVSDRYLTTTTDATKAVAVYAEKAEGGYKLYILKDGVKNYITMYVNSNNKDCVNYDPAGATVYAYNPTLNAFVANLNGTDKYLGTYYSSSSNKVFTTISVSNLSYLTTENYGVTQFPLELLPVAIGTELQGSFTQAKPTEKTLYLNGGVDGRYLATTENLSEAVKVYAEKVEGGYKFYILVEDVKNYITIYNNSESKTSVNYDPNGNTVFTYKADVNAWATTFDGKDRYLGSYYNSSKDSTFSTVSVSDLSYINAENTGVTQYPLTYSIPAHVCSFADATCTAPATCSCGAVEEGSTALGHNNVDNVCSRCGAKYVTVTEAATLADDTLVIIEATVSKITFAWSDSSKNMSVDITDGTTTLNAYKLASKVGAGDVIVIYGKVGSHNDTKQIASGATAEIKTAHVCSTYTEGKCPVCGAADPSAVTSITTSAPVTSASQITNGCKIVIASGNNIMGASAGNYYARIALTANENKGYTFNSDAGVEVITVEVNNDGTYALKSSSGYLLAVASNNHLKYTDDKTNALAKWNIEFGEDGTVKIFVVVDEATPANNRYIQYNGNSGQERFSGYKNTQANPIICLVP